MHLKDQNISVAIETYFSVMLFLFLFFSFFHVSLLLLSSDSFLLMTSSLFSSLTLITQSIIKEMKNVLFSSDSFLSITSSLFSSVTIVSLTTQGIYRDQTVITITRLEI